MSEITCALNAGLQVDDGSCDWGRGDAPMKFVCATGPLPGISTASCPGHISAVDLVETLVGPPGTLAGRKGVGIAQDGHAISPCVDIGLMDDSCASHMGR